MRNVLQLLKLTFTILFISPVFACIWIFVARMENQADPAIVTWLEKSDVRTEGWFVQYTYSFYFTMVTMITVGYGNYTSPQKKKKKKLSSHSLK